MLDNFKDKTYDPSMALIRRLVAEYINFPLSLTHSCTALRGPKFPPAGVPQTLNTGGLQLRAPIKYIQPSSETRRARLGRAHYKLN